MKKVYSSIGVMALVMGVQSTFADSVTICKHDDQVREIQVVYDVEGQTVPCSVNYVKDTGTQTLWRADNAEGFCEEQAAAFVAKQESWGWMCEAQTTASDMVDDAAEEVEEVIDEVEDAAAEAQEAVEEAVSDDEVEDPADS